MSRDRKNRERKKSRDRTERKKKREQFDSFDQLMIVKKLLTQETEIEETFFISRKERKN